MTTSQKAPATHPLGQSGPPRRSWLPLLLMITGVLVFLSACATPQQRYKTLSFFFDGVPNPNAPKPTTQPSETQPSVITASVISSRHKPYVDGKCDACHRSASGNIMEFEEAYKSCVKCHKEIPTKLPLMHGPVARGQCKWCHTPHESREPHLLKDDPVKVCVQCHDTQLLGASPPAHTDGHTNCLQCHFGHGGTAHNFLKPDAVPEWPAGTQPAPSPATPPATAPAPPALSLPAGISAGATPILEHLRESQ